MAKFDAKSFNEKAFGKYMSAVPNPKLNIKEAYTKFVAILNDKGGAEVEQQ